MPNAAITNSSPPDRQHFRPTLWRLVLALALAATTTVGVGWLSPVALVYVVPTLAVVLAVVAFACPGLIVSSEGIEWYALRPRWRFRKVPWHAVRDVRRGLFGLGKQIKVIVEPGKYEPWVLGRPRPGRPMVIEIWTRGLTRGWKVWDSIQRFRLLPEQAGGVVLAD